MRQLTYSDIKNLALEEIPIGTTTGMLERRGFEKGFNACLLRMINTILELKVDWRDSWYISETDINGIRLKDTREYWEKLKKEIGQ